MIERYGGSVEKFIGDAVVGVFGVPVVHEDDPERAVRAALRLVEGLDELSRPDGAPFQARAGVMTGELLVAHDVDPAHGRRLRGRRRDQHVRRASRPPRRRAPSSWASSPTG